MEKLVMGFGFGIVCVSFFLCLGVGTQFAWGVLIGTIVTWIGDFFSDM